MGHFGSRQLTWSKTKTHLNSATDDKRQGTTNKQECKKRTTK